MNETERDLCSPSQLNLRFHCPGSAQLEAKLIRAGFKEKSEAADRGTRLHEIMEIYGRDGVPVESHGLSGSDLEAVQFCAETVDDIVGSVSDQNPVQQFEVQIDLSELGISGGKHGCRIDRVVLLPGVGTIFIDYKFGFKWVTDPQFNWQLKAYAWGVNRKFGGDVQAIAMQPANDEDRQVLSYAFKDGDFDNIGNEIKAIVDATRAVDAKLCRGRHCSALFCKNKIACPLWTSAALSIPYPHTIASFIIKCSPEERQNILNELKRAQSWVNSARSTIEAMAIDGAIEIRGYRVKPKERWRWINEEVAYEAAKNLLVASGRSGRVSDLYEPAQMKSRSAVQEIIGGSKAAKIFIDMNTVKDEIEDEYTLEQIEDDVDSVAVNSIT